VTGVVERVARTLSGLAGNAPHEDWRPFEMPARAVIEAMREPDAAMAAAGAKFFKEGGPKQNASTASIVWGL
jgi:hypothetical protein